MIITTLQLILTQQRRETDLHVDWVFWEKNTPCPIPKLFLMMPKQGQRVELQKCKTEKDKK